MSNSGQAADDGLPLPKITLGPAGNPAVGARRAARLEEGWAVFGEENALVKIRFAPDPTQKRLRAVEINIEGADDETGAEVFLEASMLRDLPLSFFEEIVNNFESPLDARVASLGSFVAPRTMDDLTAAERSTDALARLKAAPDGLTDEFLRTVAEAYRAAHGRPGSSIIKTLASHAGAPPRTVEGWVYEARKRGLMPPARKGRPATWRGAVR